MGVQVPHTIFVSHIRACKLKTWETYKENIKIQFKIAFLIIFLAGCVPSPAIPVDAQNTAMVAVQTYIALTQTALPTPVVLSTTTPEATLIPTLPSPPILTPDAVQVERWQEYQRELIKALLIQYPSTLHDLALCEWDILGRFEQKLYVWALCGLPGGGGADIPAIIHINIDGSVQNVEVPSRGSTWKSDINKMFPNEVQEKFDRYTGNSNFYGRIREMIDHIKYREQHPETLPLVVLSHTPVATPIPTQLSAPIFTPDAIQVERWREYQTELAKVVLSFKKAGIEYDPEIAEDALCEWDILGRAGQEVYVFVVCVFPKGHGDMRIPAIIYLKSDGSIRLVKHPETKVTNSSVFNYDPFPVKVQEKFCHYFSFQSDLFSCSYFGTAPRPRLDMLYAHIEYRKTHPEEPPLVILSSYTPIPP